MIVSFVRQWSAGLVDALGAVVVVGLALRLALRMLEIKASVQAVVDVIHVEPARLIPVVVVVPVALLLWHLLPLALMASPGQRLLGLRLVDKAGLPPAATRLILRAAVASLSTACFFAGPAWGLLVDPWRRSWADIAAGTVAVRR